MSNGRVSNSLKSLGKLGFKMDHSRIIAISTLAIILFVAFSLRVLPIFWEIQSGAIRLNEFDPYYQYSLVNHMVQDGLLSPYYPTQWVTTQQWYPSGLNMAISLPSLPLTTAILYQIVSVFGNVDLMAFCAMMPVVFGTLACFIIYFLGKDFGGRTVGLFSALFLAMAPSFLQRSALGFFDTELPGILGLLSFIFLFLRAIDQNRSLRSTLIYSVGASLALAYFILGWGAAYYVVNLAALFVLTLVLLKRYNQRLLISYSVTFSIAFIIATQFPYFGLGYLVSGPIIPVVAIFVILLLAELLRFNVSAKTKLTITVAAVVALVGTFIPLWILGYLGSIAGKFISVVDPFLRSAAPLIASVAEHRISAWGNIYLELGVGVLFFIVGLYFVIKNPTNKNIFLLIFGITSLYFAASMVRLLVIFAPAFAIIMALGLMGILKPFYNLLKETPSTTIKMKRKLMRVSKEYSGLAILLIFVLLVTQFAFSPQVEGMKPRAYSSAFAPTSLSSSSLPIAFNTNIPQWLDMLTYTATDLKSTDIVVAWWDYGYWLSILGNVTTLADNATVNSTQIENIGFAFMGTEEQALKMISTYGQDRAKYILVFLTLIAGESSSSDSTTPAYTAYQWGYGDEGKWFWMARISGGANERLLNANFMTPTDQWTDEFYFGNYSGTTNQWVWNARGMNSTIYKLLTNAEAEYCLSTGGLLSSSSTISEPTYFSMKKLMAPTNPLQYSGAIPVVALYEIDWAAYNNATKTTG